MSAERGQLLAQAGAASEERGQLQELVRSLREGLGAAEERVLLLQGQMQEQAKGLGQGLGQGQGQLNQFLGISTGDSGDSDGEGGEGEGGYGVSGSASFSTPMGRQGLYSPPQAQGQGQVQTHAQAQAQVLAQASRLARAEAQVDDLLSQLHASGGLLEDLQLQHDKLSVRLHGKTRAQEEAQAELALLRAEVEALLCQGDHSKLLGMRAEAGARLREIDNEGEIDILRLRVGVLEAEVVGLGGRGDELRTQLMTETGTSAALRGELESLQREEGELVGLLGELRGEKEEAERGLRESFGEAEGLAGRGGEMEIEVEALQAGVARGVQEVEAAEARVGAVEAEGRAEVSRLGAILDQQCAEKEQLLVLLKAAQVATGAAEAGMRGAVERTGGAERGLRGVVDMVAAFHSQMMRGETLLLEHMGARLGGVEVRMDRAVWGVEEVGAEVGGVAEERRRGQEQAVRMLEDTQSALELALARHETDDEEKAGAWERAEAAESLEGQLRQTIQDQAALLAEQMNTSQAHSQHAKTTDSELNSLRQRLGWAESGAEKMAAENGHIFAQGARAQAYLEGELGRFRTLLDHQRVVNLKLQGDLRVAGGAAVQCAALGHRAALAEQEREDADRRAAALQGGLQAKQAELLALMGGAARAEESRAAQHEGEMNTLRAAHHQSQQAWEAQQAAEGAAREAQEARSSEGVARLELQGNALNRAEMALQGMRGRAERAEGALAAATKQGSDRDTELAEAGAALLLLQEEARAQREAVARLTAGARAEGRERGDLLRAAEEQVCYLRGQVGRLESGFVQRDEEVARSMQLRLRGDEEGRAMRERVDAITGDCALLRARAEDLADSLQVSAEALAASRAAESALQSKHSALLGEHFILQGALGVAQGEAEVAREEGEGLRGLLGGASEEVREAEARLQAIQTEFLSIQAQEASLTATLGALTSDNAYLKKQLEE
ncbi:hypothetical protein B484DRAFT_389785, partial [Ochromonadaceae sp. CCMP2298]